MAPDKTDIDEQALELRGKSKGFGKISEALGLPRPNDANEAFNRALRRRSPDEQVKIRQQENARLDLLARSVSADSVRTQDEIDKRLRAIDRLRNRLMAE
ncbi:MAG: hypothetical protein AB1673_07660 [Actinomycetota bacterium]|jgi:hypothetical protein